MFQHVPACLWVDVSSAWCVSVCVYPTGMNLTNGLEQHPDAFLLVTAGSLALGAGLFGACTVLAKERGHGEIQRDMQSMQAYQNIFAHIRSVTHALYRTVRSGGRGGMEDRVEGDDEE
jgi:hypothetical protein